MAVTAQHCVPYVYGLPHPLSWHSASFLALGGSKLAKWQKRNSIPL